MKNPFSRLFNIQLMNPQLRWFLFFSSHFSSLSHSFSVIFGDSTCVDSKLYSLEKCVSVIFSYSVCRECRRKSLKRLLLGCLLLSCLLLGCLLQSAFNVLLKSFTVAFEKIFSPFIQVRDKVNRNSITLCSFSSFPSKYSNI